MDEFKPPSTPPNPWQPERDPLTIAILGKMLEEVNELGSALSRCLIQGTHEKEPMTGRFNREWLEDEMADITAAGQIVMEHFQLDTHRMGERASSKFSFLIRWLDQLRVHP